MKDSSVHIAPPSVQKQAVPFFQRSADETREDSAFFSNVQTKLNVGAKDDPMEKEADVMADKVASQSASGNDTKAASGTDSVQSKVESVQAKSCDPCATIPNIQREGNPDDEVQKKEEDHSISDQSKSPVAADGNTNGSVQRYYSREVEDADQIFRDPDPNVAGMSKRDAVIAVAKTMLGKIKAKQPGGGGERFGARELWEIFKLAAPGVWTEEQIKTFGQPFPHWCGIFTVWAHKKAGIDLGNWQIGKGVSAFGTLKETSDPQPGDIGYIHSPNQHHALITKVGANIESIDGNSGLFSEVVENTRPKTAYTTFYTGHSGSSSGTVSPKKEAGIQAKGDGTSSAPSTVESGISSTKGRGDSLSPSVQSEMQSGLGGDFSKVKIHTDSNAAQMNKDLQSQAFAHGGDVYFNENKFNPGTSAGKHLLAHELTHTIQQGAAPSLQEKSLTNKVQKKSDKNSTVIQRGPDPAPDAGAGADPGTAGGTVSVAPATPDDEKKIKDAEKKESYIKKYGVIRVSGTTFEIQLFDFPLKQYANLTSYFEPMLTPADNPPPIEAPKPKTRKTDQGKLWRDNVKDEVTKGIKNKILPKGLENESELELSLTGKGKPGAQDTKIVGTLDELIDQAMIPFWDNGGHPQIHEIEHKVDWQILGDKADTIDNLCLLDKPSNGYLGKKVAKDIKFRIEKVLDFYINTVGIKTLVPDASTARKAYTVKFMSFKTSETKTRSIIGHMNMNEKAGLTPITPDNIAIKKFSLPAGHLIFKTAKSGSGAGFILPYDFKSKNGKLVMEGEYVTQDGKKVYELKKITATKWIRDPNKVIPDYEDDMEVKFFKDGSKPDHYNLDQKGWAYAMKNRLRLQSLSPIELDDNPELDPELGVTATGKVKSDIALLKDADIEFGLKDSDFFISTTITPEFLKGNKKIPNPFSIDYGSVTITASSDEGLSVDGQIGFGIEKLGKGSVQVGINSKKEFNVSGEFLFDKSDKSIFDGKIGFTYEKKKWKITGDATMVPKNLKGIKKGSIHFEYDEASETISLSGDAQLTVPGISQIKIDSKIGKEGDFEVSVGVDLEKIPRVKSGKVTVTIGRHKPGAAQPGAGQAGQESEWDLGIVGEIDPDFDYKGLSNVKAKFAYAKGAYDISITAKYDRGKIHADLIEVGLTNKPVSADGKKLEGEPTKDMTFYGELKLKADIYEGISGKIDSKLLPDGDVTVDGTVEVEEDKQMFSVEPLNKEIFKVEKDIPIASCVVVTLNLFIGGSIMLYADFKPLMIKKGSYVKVGNLSLKKFDDPRVNSKIILGSSLLAGAKVTLAVGLSASLLGIIKARISGEAGVDFMAIDAAITGILEMAWAKGTGLEINEASISMEMASKLKVSFGVKAEVLIDLWLTTIGIWDHTWPVAAETFDINLFGNGKKTWKLPIESGGKVGQPDKEKNLQDVHDKANVEEVQKRAKNKSEGKGQTDEDKQAMVQKVTQDEVIANFRKPERLVFDRSEDYLVTRYGLYNYLKENAGKDEKIDLTFVDAEIRKAEFEEYDAFTTFIMSDTSFNDDAKSLIIEDFIVNHPTLVETEIVNLRSLIPVKAPPSQKSNAKERGKTAPKQTADITSPVRPMPVQKKAKSGGAGGRSVSSAVRRGKQVLKNKSRRNNQETREGYELVDMDDGLIPEHELASGDRDATLLPEIDGIEEVENNDDTFKPFYMRPYSRTRRPLQQRAEEKSKSPFFSGPEKKERTGSAFFQAKLNVGEADDQLEKEADKMADSVTGKGAKKEDRKEDIAKGAGVGKPEQEANKGKTPGADKLPAEEKKKEDKSVQKKGNEEREEENKTVVDKKANAPAAAPSKANKVESAISEKNGKGGSLPGSALHEMNSSFGKDFSDVRIHTDSEAATLNEELDAQAFTSGKDIYFNSGKFDPESDSGKHLLAHELTHVIQQNPDTIRRDAKAEKAEKDRAQQVRDNYTKALKAKAVNWEEVAMYFNAFNEPEQRQKMAQLNGQQLFLLHQGAINVAGGGPYCAAALITTPIPGMDSAVAAAIETQMVHYNYQAAIDLAIEDLDKRGVIDRSLLTGGRMLYLEKKNISGEGRVVAPGFDPQTGKSKSVDANIGGDAFSPSAGLPLLITTIIHEFQHVHQMQKKDESKALIPDQGNDESTHLQQEVEAYATEMVHAKETGLFNQPDQMEGAWGRLQSKWEQLIDDRKKPLNDLYKKAYEVAKQAVGKSLLVFTPMKP